MSPAPPPVPGGRTPEEREAARLEREARRAAREGRPPPQQPRAQPAPPDVLRAEALAPEPAARRAAPAPASAATGTAVPPSRPEETAEHPAATDGYPAATDGHGRDWLGEARRLTHGGDGGGREPGGRRTARGRRGPGRLIALGALVLILAAIGWFLVMLLQPFKDDDGKPVRVTIPQGSSLSDIADRLEKSGVIDDAGFFQLRARINGDSGNLRPGSYELREDMTYAAALDVLKAGVPPNVVQVAIPEGLSRKEIRPLTAGLRGNYTRATRRSPSLDPSDYGAKRASSLEGFLFPATYELKKGQRVTRLREQQLAQFKRNFEKVDLGFAKRKNLNAYDVLIIASLVEREAMVAKERPIIASVIYNRLRDDIRLDIDATTRFAVGNWKRPLRVSELQNPSPYNTRVHPGLPPGPIGNPGLASIKAAAHPARTGFLFYVVKPGTCGKHNFAKTDAEFQGYVNEYNRAREKNGGKSPTTC
ncbi:MAG TPA: endolytic transglycosylase MltG [Thermoleophilaceae bacterium]|nr:endolytic transglycosylase MltG [Thermoleophilaceae bacterium]